MWLFTRFGFFSVTLALEDPTGQTVQVRARVREDIEALDTWFLGETGTLLGDDIISTPRRDYQYRMYVPKARWAEAARLLAQDLNYSNFKAQIRDHERHDVYAAVWGLLNSRLGFRSRTLGHNPPRPNHQPDSTPDRPPAREPKQDSLF